MAMTFSCGKVYMTSAAVVQVWKGKIRFVWLPYLNTWHPLVVSLRTCILVLAYYMDVIDRSCKMEASMDTSMCGNEEI